jgi:autophagy-related protein 9
MDDIFFNELGEVGYSTYKELESIVPKKNNFVNNIFGYNNSIKNKHINTDQFYSDVYDYYYRGGYYTIITSSITEILSLIFGILFAVFLFILLDWQKILQCGTNNEIKDCGELYIYIHPRTPNIFFIMVLVFSVIFTLCKIIVFVFNFKNIKNIYNFYTDVLTISSNELHTMSWSKIINKISTINDVDISICNITNKILRKENYLIALIKNNIIKTPYTYMYTRQLELNIKYIVLNDINNIDSENLKKKFIIYGLLNLLLSLIIFIYLFVYFVVSNIDEFYSNKDILGSRKYSLFAKRKFREYNELIHFFEKRINKSVPHSINYIKNFPSPVSEVIGKFIGIICGAFIVFFLVLSILDESILLYVRLFDRSLLFYTGIIGAISSCARGFIKKPENTIHNPSEIMDKVYKYTRYMPVNWLNKTHTYNIRDEFLKLFPYSFILFLHDLLSVITTPYILLFVLPKQCNEITNFIMNNTAQTVNNGLICSFANFETNSKSIDKKMEQSISYFTEINSIDYDSSFI